MMIDSKGNYNDNEVFEKSLHLSTFNEAKLSNNASENKLQKFYKDSEFCNTNCNLQTLVKNAKSLADSFKYDEAVACYQKILTIGLESNNEEIITETLDSLGKIYTLQNKLQKALESYSSALKIKEKKNDLIGISYFITRLGVINIQLGKYEEALQLFLKSLAIEENLGKDEAVAISLNNIGILFKSLGNNQKSLEYHNKALVIFQNIGNQKGEAYSYNNIGNNYKKLNHYEKALDYYIQSLQINQHIKDKNGIANSFNNIGNCYMKMKQYDTALEYLQKGVVIRKEMNDQRGIVILTLNIANVHLFLNNIELALQEANDALEIARNIEIKPLIKESYQLLAQLYSHNNNFQKAFYYSELLAEIKASIYSEESSKKIAEMQTKYEIQKKEKEAEIYKLKNVELATANKKIKEQSEQLELINKILRHDIKNNLSVILSAIKLFSRMNDKSYLDEAVKKVKKSTELIDKMREMETLMKSNMNLKPFSLTKVLQAVLKNFQNRDIQVSLLPVNVLADDTIYSVFDNIIANAFIHGKTEKVMINLSENPVNIFVEITDFGIGIPDSIKNNIFDENFHYGDTGNTGIGLYIVKKAIKSYGGEIYVKDNKPNGSVFVIKLKKMEYI